MKYLSRYFPYSLYNFILLPGKKEPIHSNEEEITHAGPPDYLEIIGDGVARACEEEKAIVNECRINPTRETRNTTQGSGLAVSTEFGTYIHFETSEKTDLQPPLAPNRLENPKQQFDKTSSCRSGRVPSRSHHGRQEHSYCSLLPAQL